MFANASFQPKRRTSVVQGVDTIREERYIRNSSAKDVTGKKREPLNLKKAG
jgi:hypothetical protein